MAARTNAMAIASGSAYPASVEEKAHDVESPPSVDELTRVGSRQSFNQLIGVTKIESLYMVYGKGWKLVALWVSIGLIAYCWSLAAITTAIYGAFATSSFGKHTIVGTSAVITNIIAAVTLPILARICDVLSRPGAIAIALFLFTLGYMIVAGAPTIYGVVAGEAIFTAGRGGLYQIMHILISDITPLRWRGVILGIYSLPFVMNGFLAGEITTGIRVTSLNGGDGWRWGYGMFCIIVPVAITPSLIVLFWGHQKAKKLGALSLASSTYARRRVLEGEGAAPHRTRWQLAVEIFHQVDTIGLTLFTFSLALLLTPPTLEPFAKGGYSNPSLIAMYCVGGVLFIAFVIWEQLYARYPICPRRLLNRTFLACLAVDALHFFSGYLTDAYYNSWVYILKPQWTSREYTYFSNIHNTGLSIFAGLTGVALYFFQRYKAIQVTGVAIRCIGEGLNFMTANAKYQSDAMLIISKTIISMGAGMIMTTTAVAAPGSVPHADLASAMAILHMVAQLGGSIAGSISAAIWNTHVPRNLKKYLPQMTDKERKAIFDRIPTARRAQPHDLVARAYSEAMWYMLVGAIVTSCVAFVISLTVRDFKLGRNHNSVETHKEVYLRNKDEVTDEAIKDQVAEAEERARLEMSGVKA